MQDKALRVLVEPVPGGSQVTEHFRTMYACGKHVESQCRCPSQSKRVTTSKTPCPECTPVSEPLNIREAEERAKKVWTSDPGTANPVVRLNMAGDLLALAALYREAVEALERIVAVEDDPTIFPAYSGEKTKRQTAAVDASRTVLAKARAALKETK